LTLSALPAAELRVGAGAAKITPPPGAPMAGYYYNRAASGVHDDLWAKAIVLEADGARSAIVGCRHFGAAAAHRRAGAARNRARPGHTRPSE